MRNAHKVTWTILQIIVSVFIASAASESYSKCNFTVGEYYNNLLICDGRVTSNLDFVNFEWPTDQYNLDVTVSNYNLMTVLRLKGSELVIKLQLIDNDFYVESELPQTLQSFPNLIDLSLAGNGLSPYVITNLVKNLKTIGYLNVSSNGIGHKSISKHMFKSLPVLQSLALDYNYLQSKHLALMHLENIMYLHLSHNEIDSIDNIRLPNVQFLDLSANNLQTVPTTFDKNCPRLTTLKLDNNGFISIRFEDALPSLQSLSLNFLENVTSIDEDSFSSIESSYFTELDIQISNCSNLRFIHPDAFEGLKICALDLSNNSIEHIPTYLNYSQKDYCKPINLAGNPLNIKCEIQSLVDSLNESSDDMMTPYDTTISNSNCSENKTLSSTQIVKFLKAKQDFCDDDKWVEQIWPEFDRHSRYPRPHHHRRHRHHCRRHHHHHHRHHNRDQDEDEDDSGENDDDWNEDNDEMDYDLSYLERCLRKHMDFRYFFTSMGFIVILLSACTIGLMCRLIALNRQVKKVSKHDDKKPLISADNKMNSYDSTDNII